MATTFELQRADLEELRVRGKDRGEAERQLAQVRDPPPPASLVRPATVGDGILALSEGEQAECEELGREAIVSDRVTKFVPASGAATRMFEALSAGKAEALARFDSERGRLNLGDDWRPYASQPKALIPFHRYPDGARTAFEEHLEEARRLGLRRLHFTVSPEHRAAFEVQLARQPAGLEVTFSEQKPSTDTLATDGQGRPLRDDAARLVFRPGGHGALLENLADLGADLVLIKNIDNISHARLWQEQLRWKRILLGVVVRAGAVAGAVPGAVERPVRACGMVKNSGEPGGGPFWVRRPGGVDLQIVESAQVDAGDPAQQALFASSTHFNPVDIAAYVKGFDLRRFRDDSAAFVVRKSRDGQPMLAVELPGLWNGSMADWHTIFVEVPAESFNPVKTVFDLLRPAHQDATR
jgi:hypothetical protein